MIWEFHSDRRLSAIRWGKCWIELKKGNQLVSRHWSKIYRGRIFTITFDCDCSLRGFFGNHWGYAKERSGIWRSGLGFLVHDERIKKSMKDTGEKEMADVGNDTCLVTCTEFWLLIELFSPLSLSPSHHAHFILLWSLVFHLEFPSLCDTLPMSSTTSTSDSLASNDKPTKCTGPKGDFVGHQYTFLQSHLEEYYGKVQSASTHSWFPILYSAYWSWFDWYNHVNILLNQLID